VRALLSISAVGSLREALAPTHLVVPDQLIDRTRGRVSTFFGDGIVGHVGFADPYCPTLREALVTAARQTGTTVHDGGVYVCMEGPAFSTRAESHLYRSWNAAVIGMTALPEAKLAREAELCYATLALVTDYDCWHEEEEAVSVSMVMETMKKNTTAAKAILRTLSARFADGKPVCGCENAAAHAVMTDPAAIPAGAKERLALFYAKYWS
jgi:5'-methylthioadenosine phosphorylase